MPSIGQLLRGSDREFFDLFERPAPTRARRRRCSTRCSRAFRRRSGLTRDIVVCEQDGDRLTHELVKRINQTFVTPIDREDILRAGVGARRHRRLHRGGRGLPRAVQDRGADGPGSGAGPACCSTPTRQIARRSRGMREFKRHQRHTVEVHRLENEGDRIARGGDRGAVRGGIDPMVVIRWKDIFERLEDAIDSTERAAVVLEGIVIKNA